MIFETHAHYDDEKFDGDRVELLSHLLQENNIKKIVNVGANIQGSKNSIQLAEEYENVYAAIGVHPEDINELDESAIKWLIEQSERSKVVAIGEIGLDYYWCEDAAGREEQRKGFAKQLEVAKQVDLPVIIHSRDACEDTFNILKDYTRNKAPGIIHCFSYTKETAKLYVDRGWYIGVGGVVTFKNGKKLVEVVKETPIERIVLETDSPYMAPVPHRGERNCSIYLKYVAEKIAEIKNLSVEEVENITYRNAEEVYGIFK